MEISVFSIQKSRADIFENEIKEYIKMSAKFANINDKIIFSDKIAKAQTLGRLEALSAYNEVYEPNLKGFCIALDERGESLDSYKFAKIFENNAQINFFIGGAYGLSDELKQKMQRVISLSKMTIAHKIAKLVLFEQIFRGLCINANHPYHK
ncbi:23S rRNA (pseudouridine(1915)-N(3))-methyltransferase RlmH [Campylobacter sp. faydin G-24]|uniref:Ribosomal RNA large subunit methyltransferase H n=1 Tax=Campylobacter anatolicus TaxID=2829105 RepID=A0ABS5HJI2_9BACT|nr:23S rRNA (pseudouridine(1915)-N(3))-methyltransferase RlmH [Campylobacter anatolicus]MBR8464297.1 23S rRNA (pseudouridine(1915)-N(3))-methyltransferase RlmH [Campylobacter anatolicus]MBR8465009.1 23S rRNA (pseudouridine(1915)-N(3))-methyltransferase RlmH [Campylobacter anatolicus]